MKRLSIPEVLESLENKSSEEKVKILKENDSKALRDILALNFRDDVIFNLPKERPSELKLEETPIGLSTNTLYQQSRKLKIFIKGSGYDHLPQLKRENLFLQILESIHSSEAELLLQLCVDRKLKTSLTLEEVNKAFPGLVPVKEVEKVETPPEENTPKKKEKKVYKDLQEVYEENTPKKVKKSKNKKSSKKKSK